MSGPWINLLNKSDLDEILNLIESVSEDFPSYSSISELLCLCCVEILKNLPVHSFISLIIPKKTTSEIGIRLILKPNRKNEMINLKLRDEIQNIYLFFLFIYLFVYLLTHTYRFFQ